MSKHRRGEGGCTKAGRGREEEGSHGGRGGRPASGSLVHSTDLGRAPEEMVVVRGQEGMSVVAVAVRAFSLSCGSACCVVELLEGFSIEHIVDWLDVSEGEVVGRRSALHRVVSG